MKLKFIAFAVLALVLANQASAQLKITGEFRTRSILDHGFMYPVLENTNPEVSIDQRSRLNFSYSSDKYSAFIAVQDARMWGADDMVTKAGAWGNSNSLGVHEAWVNLNIGSNSHLKLGRQEWNYDNMRILSWRNWATGALSYDAALFQTHKESLGISLDIGLSYNNNSNAMGVVDNSSWEADKLKTMNFIRIHKEFPKNTYVSLISTLAGKTDTSNNAVLGTGTHGLTVVYNKGKKANAGLFAAFEGYYQHGTDLKRAGNGNYKSISAYMLTGELGWRSAKSNLELSVGGELLSGNDYSNTDADYNSTRHSFDLLYGGRLPYYGGYMNHFIIQDSYLLGTKGGGYFDPYFKVKYKLNNKNIIEAAVFTPMLTTNVRAHTSINPTTNKPMGAEVDQNGNPVYWKGNLGYYFDVNYAHKVNKQIILKAGASYAHLSDIKNQMVFGYADVADQELNQLGQNYFAWAMLIIKPTFFNK